MSICFRADSKLSAVLFRREYYVFEADKMKIFQENGDFLPSTCFRSLTPGEMQRFKAVLKSDKGLKVDYANNGKYQTLTIAPADEYYIFSPSEVTPGPEAFTFNIPTSKQFIKMNGQIADKDKPTTTQPSWW